MENLIRTRICELRKIMKESGIEIYIIPTGDYHQSEYISDYFKEREYITGFTGDGYKMAEDAGHTVTDRKSTRLNSSH